MGCCASVDANHRGQRSLPRRGAAAQAKAMSAGLPAAGSSSSGGAKELASPSAPLPEEATLRRRMSRGAATFRDPTTGSHTGLQLQMSVGRSMSSDMRVVLNAETGDSASVGVWNTKQDAKVGAPPDVEVPNMTNVEILSHLGDLVCVRMPDKSECFAKTINIKRLDLQPAATPLTEGSSIGDMGNWVPRTEPIEFYGYAGVDYRELVSFFPVNFYAMEYMFPSLEHFFQAMKFQPTPEHFHEVRSASTADAAREMGKDRGRPLRKDWEGIKEQVIYEGMLYKFSQNAGCREVLLTTGDRLLIFADENDNYWGMGQDKMGKNKYGHLLMEVRSELRWQQMCPGAQGTRPRLYQARPLEFYGYGAEYGELNSYYPSPFSCRGSNFSTMEHFFQAMKFEGTDGFEKVRNAKTAFAAAQLGRSRDFKLRSDWDCIRMDVFEEGLIAKFTQDHHCRKVLMSTGQRDLQYGDTGDGFWGCGPDGKGKNTVGKLLQHARNVLYWRQEVGIIQQDLRAQQRTMRVQQELVNGGSAVSLFPRTKAIGRGSGGTRCYEVITLPSALNISMKIIPLERDELRELGLVPVQLVYKVVAVVASLCVGAVSAVPALQCSAEKEADTSKWRPIKEEMLLMKQLHHPNIISYVGLWADTDTRELYLFMELACGNLLGRVREVTRHLPGKTLPIDVVRSYTQQILRGLAYLHCSALVHQDLRAVNILVGANGQPMLADFGVAYRLRCSGIRYGRYPWQDACGSQRWAAPEVLAETHRGGPACDLVRADVWSLGCTVLEMLSTRQGPAEPWASLKGASAEAQVAGIIDSCGMPWGGAPPVQMADSGRRSQQALTHFLRACFRREGHDREPRPTAEALLQFDFITQISQHTQEESCAETDFSSINRAQSGPDSGISQ